MQALCLVRPDNHYGCGYDVLVVRRVKIKMQAVFSPSGVTSPRSFNGTNIEVRQLPGGRQEFSCSVGVITAKVVAIPAGNLTGEEWDTICRARQSYFHQWGGKITTCNDPFDGRSAYQTIYRVTHYIAIVNAPGQTTKILTMRKISCGTDFDPKNHSLPPDITLWNVVNRHTGQAQPLWDFVKIWLDHTQPHRQIAAIGRVGVYPYQEQEQEERPKTEAEKVLRRNTTAVAFALIQVAATYDAPEKLIFSQQRPEMVQKVLALLTSKGLVRLDFTPTARTLELASDLELRLNNALPEVQHLKTHYPGAWFDTVAAGRILEEQVAEGLIPAELLHSCMSTDAEKEPKSESVAIVRELATVRNFKYLVPLLERAEEIKLGQGVTLRQHLLAHGGDGPVSTCYSPGAFGMSALELIAACREG
jgi:hypothetical protein